ncbi:hypothetical protein OG304_38285 [Streptomyces sp. NBC_00160]|uniref:Lipoprotein n=1 Tax=Streptomyces spororaveus TaxID=284039 RepID=A0ABQ3T2T8_9ACTN|nr:MULTISPECIES: hypothetical protein [Streptomyces]MCX5309213.1 hypothetical protein [Streptomyces sp. NBC_00160]GHI74699.1 hypothetical protein Sspor_02600 [Streptomyces spororaveus]
MTVQLLLVRPPARTAAGPGTASAACASIGSTGGLSITTASLTACASPFQGPTDQPETTTRA